MAEQEFLEISEKGIERTLQNIALVPEAIRISKVTSMKSTGYMLQQAVVKYIQGGGQNWPRAAEVTKSFATRKGRRGTDLFRRGNYDGLLVYLSRFIRYRVDNSDKFVEIGYGTGFKKGRGKFDRVVTGFARRAHKGRKSRVTKKMRGLFGSSREDNRDISGKDFFPLRAETKDVVVPPRPFMPQVFRQMRDKIFPRFEERFDKKFEKEKKKKDL